LKGGDGIDNANMDAFKHYKKIVDFVHIR